MVRRFRLMIQHAIECAHLFGICLNLWGAPILKLENSGGRAVHSKKHRSPGRDVSAQSVEQAILAGGLYPVL